MRSRLRLLLLLAPLALGACDLLGIEPLSQVQARREAEGKAIGSACRHAGRAIEDCYTLNRKAEKAAIFAGWREMNDYMTENKIAVVAPTIPTPETLAEKVRLGHHRMHCDFAFWVGGTHDNAKDIPELERLPGSAGIKVFMGSSTGSLLVADDPGVSSVLAKTRRRAAFHSEDEYRLEERKPLRVKGDPNSHIIWRDVTTALQCTQRLVHIARQQGAAIHVLHISTMEEIAFLSHHKDVATAEATPHHLTLDSSLYDTLGTKLQMNPPVREAHHRDGIWRGISSGVIDVLGSDHAPHTLEEKAKPYPESPSGMTGVQTLVPVMLDHVNAGRLSLARFVDLTSAGPSRIFQIARKGRIAEGYDADFTVVDMKRSETIRNEWIASRCGWTPYDGKQVTGWPVGTFVRGARVMWQGELTTPSRGEAVRFVQAL